MSRITCPSKPLSLKPGLWSTPSGHFGAMPTTSPGAWIVCHSDRVGAYLNPIRACVNDGIVKASIIQKSESTFLPPSIAKTYLRKRYDYQARKNPCYGFESVPADVVVFFANKAAKYALGSSAYIMRIRFPCISSSNGSLAGRCPQQSFITTTVGNVRQLGERVSGRGKVKPEFMIYEQ